jgi:hypothetical protein
MKNLGLKIGDIGFVRPLASPPPPESAVPPHLWRLPFADVQVGPAFLHDDAEKLIDVRHFLTADYADHTDGKSGLKIRNIGWARSLLPDDALPIEASAFEVKKQSEFQSRDVQVSDHLRSVRFRKRSDDFCIYDDGILDNQIGNERAN